MPSPSPVDPALVTPRVRVDDDRELSISTAAAHLLARGEPTDVHLLAARGAGASTALAMLRATHRDGRDLAFVDHDERPREKELQDARVVVRVSTDGADLKPLDGRATQRWSLCPWTDEDCRNYLATLDPRHADAAFELWRQPAPKLDLLQWPVLCRPVLDHLSALAHNPQTAANNDAICALAFVLERLLGRHRAAARQACAATLVSGDRQLTLPRVLSSVAHMLGMRVVRALLIAEQLLMDLTQRGTTEAPTRAWRDDEASVLGHLIAVDAPLLQELLDGTIRAVPESPALLSALCEALPGFRPPRERFDSLGAARLRGINLRGRELTGDLSNADLSGAQLDGATLQAATLSEALLRRASARQAAMQGLQAPRMQADFIVAPGLIADRSDLSFSSLRGADLTAAQLRGTRLDHADLSEADLRQADLTDAQLRNTLLRSANLAGARLTAGRVEGANLAGCSLRAADLRNAKLQGCDLANCDLEQVDATGAHLRGCDLRGASLRDANLSSAALSGCALDQADLRGCDLRAARFDDVSLQGADLRGARLDPGLRDAVRTAGCTLDGSAG